MRSEGSTAGLHLCRPRSFAATLDAANPRNDATLGDSRRLGPTPDQLVMKCKRLACARRTRFAGSTSPVRCAQTGQTRPFARMACPHRCPHGGREGSISRSVRILPGPFSPAWLEGFRLEWRLMRAGSARNAHLVQTPVQTSARRRVRSGRGPLPPAVSADPSRQGQRSPRKAARGSGAAARALVALINVREPRGSSIPTRVVHW
jgi:hypothetical protein